MMDDPLYDQDESVRALEQDELTRSHLVALASSRHGQWLYARLIRRSRQQRFACNALTTAYNEGQADLASALVDELRRADLPGLHTIERLMAQGDI